MMNLNSNWKYWLVETSLIIVALYCMKGDWHFWVGLVAVISYGLISYHEGLGK